MPSDRTEAACWTAWACQESSTTAHEEEHGSCEDGERVGQARAARAEQHQEECKHGLLAQAEGESDGLSANRH